MENFWPVPYLIEPYNLALDAVLTFIVSTLLTVMIQAEAQAFAATFLGDQRVGAKDRFHFNAFLHLDVWGTLCFLAGGFGWAKPIAVDATRFAHPRTYLIITRLAGPIANLLLANIAASLVFLLSKVEIDAHVFGMVLGVNVTTAVYNFVPIPPLAAGSLLTALIPPKLHRLNWYLNQIGASLLVAWCLLERLSPPGLIRPYLDDLVKKVFAFILGL